LPAHVKLLALLAFLIVVVATPREAFWAFGVYALLLGIVASVAGIGPRFIVPRMAVEIPFVVFALLLPFIAVGEKVDVLGIPMSEAGLLGAWNILAKGTLGVVASILLAATTEPRDIILGLQRLRVPQTMVQIMAFMIRYADVVGDDMRRMRIARESRAFEGRSLAHLKVVAQSAGALFIRSYERGERVHLAMLSRGYDGRLPAFNAPAASMRSWATAATLPVCAALVALTAWMTM
jgi:cobalt/nickel transport system permease protein